MKYLIVFQLMQLFLLHEIFNSFINAISFILMFRQSNVTVHCLTEC